MKWGHHAALGRLVVVRRHHQCRIGTDFLGKLNKTDAFERVVGARARNHRHATCGGFDNHINDHLMFVMGQGRAFASGAHGNQRRRAFGDVPLNQVFERLHIHFTVTERGDEGRHGAFEHGCSPELSFIHVSGGDPPPVLHKMPGI